jgi:hypothetical protein
MGQLKKENKTWRMGTNTEMKDVLQGAGSVEFIKFLRLGAPKQMATEAMEGIRRRGRWRDEVEEDLI